MENYKISVIVPVYNLANEIERCIKSIQNQTYDNIEIIIVDDGSADDSLTVIKRLAEDDPRILPLHQNNGGVTSARLNGIRHASGDYIGFVDGDDEIESDMYRLLMDNALKYDADISHCGYQMIFDDGRINYFYNSGCLEKQDRLTALKELLSGQRIEPGLCNKLYKKALFDLILKKKTIPSDIRINEDLLFNYYLFDAANCSVFQDVCPYHYIIRHSSASRTSLNHHHIFDPIKVKNIILKDVPCELKDSAEAAFATTCINIFCMLSLEKNYSKEKKQIRHIICGRKYKVFSRKTTVLQKMIIYSPWLFNILYPVYSRFFQKKKYN